MRVPSKVVPRFWAKVQKTDGCWEWTGARQSAGYGQIGWDGKVYLAHRVAYVLAGGTLPSTLQIDHLCGNRRCVNPSHLEAVTQRENMARGNSPVGAVLRTGRCQRGHAMDDAIVDGQGWRHCAVCIRQRRAMRLAAARGSVDLMLPRETQAS